MEYLIRQAFIDFNSVCPYVAQGHYDLVGSNGAIILPQKWEAEIEPGMVVTMRVWPMLDDRIALQASTSLLSSSKKKSIRKSASSGLLSSSISQELPHKREIFAPATFQDQPSYVSDTDFSPLNFILSRYSYNSPPFPATGLNKGQSNTVYSACPNPDCGSLVEDLAAHMLTHQAERPEKCPIVTCEFHHRGFARKYDKQRHTLTHYKGTMVCGFCPGSGSAAEKYFNRADVFKRHLTSVHGVQQVAPGSLKKSEGFPSDSTGTGTCSICSLTFDNPQNLYEHLDNCVLNEVMIQDAKGGQ